MVRFGGKSDENYIMVRGDIEELVMKAKRVAGNAVPGTWFRAPKLTGYCY
jgi:hypothetical protein